MTTLRQIVTDAFRESGIIAVGTTPDADMQSEALSRLQKLIKSLFGYELGEQLRTVDYRSVSDYDSLPANIRIVFDSEGTLTLNLHENPRDGSRLGVIDNGGDFATNTVTLDGNNRKIESADSVTLATNSLIREWFYRADLGNWIRVTDLTVDSQSPFPEEFDDFLITLLAFRINPRYGAENSQSSFDVLARMRKHFRARYRQEHEMSVDDALIFLPSRFSDSERSYGTGRFNKGTL